MVKIFGIMIILSSFVSIGINEKNKLYKRMNTLLNLEKSLNIIQSELSFNNLKTRDIIQKLANNSTGTLKNVFEKIYKDDKFSIEHLWLKYFILESDKLCLEPLDLDILRNVSKILGKYDTAQQLKLLEYSKNQMNKNYVQAKEKFEKDGNLIKNTAFMFGIVAVIILI